MLLLALPLVADAALTISPRPDGQQRRCNAALPGFIASPVLRAATVAAVGAALSSASPVAALADEATTTGFEEFAAAGGKMKADPSCFFDQCKTQTTACFTNPASCKVDDYGTPAQYGPAGGQASYFAVMPSISLLNRCVPNDANSLKQDDDRCAFPQCDGVRLATSHNTAQSPRRPCF